MSAIERPFSVPHMSHDSRIKVFRRVFAPEDPLEEMEVDAFVVITTRYVVVLDTLLCPEDMAAVMHEVRDELVGRELLVVNSHADWDHCWGNSYFTRDRAVPIIAHVYAAIRMRSEEARAELKKYQSSYSYFQNVVLVPPTITFPDTLTIHGGDLTIELFSAPGHQPDHIAAWLPEIGLLLAFDAAESPLPLVESAESIQSMYNSLEHFLALHPQRVLCAHGKTVDSTVVTQNLQYLREIEQRGRVLLTTHQPTEAELEHAPTLIRYSFDDAIADSSTITDADRAFYSWAHEENVRYILQWLMQQQS